MLESHYAPITPAVCFGPSDWPAVLDRYGRSPHRPALLANPAFDTPKGWRHFKMPTGDRAYAAALYAMLREADGCGATVILLERPPSESDIWIAVHDRLQRATLAFTPLGPAGG
ncbi:MAG: Sua5 family C-terminal domain-containing protein, partial [Phycisphaerales bacterium]